MKKTVVNNAIQLENKQTIEISPLAPFNFDASFHKPDHFPSADNEWQPGICWQTMRWQGKPLGLKFENRGTTSQPGILLSIWSEGQLDGDFVTGLVAEISYRCNFQLDLSGFYRKFKNHSLLGPIIKKWRGMRPLHPGSLYEYLIIAIVLQNATVRRSVNMMQVLFAHYGVLLAYDEKQLYCFWEPGTINNITEGELRELKVGYRAKSIKRVTASFAGGVIDEAALRKKTKEEQRKTLLALYGIGPASVWYILFDVFHHMDELNYISPWEQKIYSKLFFNQEPDDPVPVDTLLLFFESFGEYKMLAVHYFWEDLFWRRKQDSAAWLEKLIRL